MIREGKRYFASKATKKVFEEIADRLSEANEDAMLADGFEDALIGLGQQFNRTVALYDRERCIDILVKRDGMTAEEANEFFEHNVVGAYLGENTPIFAEIMREVFLVS